MSDTEYRNADSIASNAASQAAASRAKEYAKSAKEEVRNLALRLSNGHTSIRLLALLGGIAMTVTSAMGILERFLTLHWFSAIVSIYTCLLGVAVVCLEFRSGGWSWLQNGRIAGIEANLRKYALFLSFVSGRGGLYFVAGTLQLSQMSFVDLVVGGYMTVVGITFLIVGKITSKKLSQLRKSSYSDKQIRQKFKNADKDHNGYLTINEFQALMKDEFDISFSKRELEVSFDYLDASSEENKRDGKVSEEEFVAWWAATQLDEVNMSDVDGAVV